MTLLTGLKQKIKITTQRSRAFNKFIVDYLLSFLSQSVEDAKEGQGLDRARTGPLLLIQRIQLFFLHSSLLASSPGLSGALRLIFRPAARAIPGVCLQAIYIQRNGRQLSV